MAIIEVKDANAWTDQTKAYLTALDADLVSQQTAEVLSRISAVYDTTGWTTPENTPTLIKKIIAMLYVGWYYQKVYSEDEDTNSYGLMLIADAERLIDGIVAETLILDAPPTLIVNPLKPSSGDVFPNDASSATPPTDDNPSNGGPAFTMGVIW